MFVQTLFEKKTGRTLLFYYTARRVKGKLLRPKSKESDTWTSFLTRIQTP